MIMNPNTEFERFTQRVFQKLEHNGVLKPSRVQHNVKLKASLVVSIRLMCSGNTKRTAFFIVWPSSARIIKLMFQLGR